MIFYLITFKLEQLLVIDFKKEHSKKIQCFNLKICNQIFKVMNLIQLNYCLKEIRVINQEIIKLFSLITSKKRNKQKISYNKAFQSTINNLLKKFFLQLEIT